MIIFLPFLQPAMLGATKPASNLCDRTVTVRVDAFPRSKTFFALSFFALSLLTETATTTT